MKAPDLFMLLRAYHVVALLADCPEFPAIFFDGMIAHPRTKQAHQCDQKQEEPQEDRDLAAELAIRAPEVTDIADVNITHG